MSAPLLMILMGAIELSIGIAIGWFLSQSEQLHAFQPARLMLDALKRAVGLLQDQSAHARELADSIRDLKAMMAAPVPDRVAELQLAARALRLSDNLELDLCQAESRIRQKIDEHESQLRPRSQKPSANWPATPRDAEFSEPEQTQDESLQPVVDIIEQLKESLSEEAERSALPQDQSGIPLVVTPLDEKFKPSGRQFRAMTRNISTRDISYVHSSPALSKMTLVQLRTPAGPPKCVLVEVMRCEQDGSSHLTVGRFIAQVPQTLSARTAENDDCSA